MITQRKAHWLRRLKKRFENRGSDGFSLIEMVTIIPVVAITSGFIVMLIASGIKVSAESAAITSAGIAVSSRATQLEGAYNCYDLKQMDNGPDTIYKQPEGRKDIRVNEAIVGTCNAGTNVKVTIAGREVGDPKNRVLYREDIQIFISE